MPKKLPTQAALYTPAVGARHASPAIAAIILALLLPITFAQPATDGVRQAAAQANPNDRLRMVVDLIRKGDRSFAAYYLLARTLNETSHPEESLQAYEAAESRAEDDQQRSMTLLRQAEIYRAIGRKVDALVRLKRSQALYQFEEASQMMAELRQSDPGIVASAQIAAALRTRDLRFEGAVVPAEAHSAGRIDIPIQFVFGQATMTPAGLLQARQLGEALREFRSGRFLVAGHTDRRGSAQANHALSLQRATAVVDFLVLNYKVPPDSFTVEGRGDTELAALGDTEEDHQINRRVEIRAR